MWDFCAYARNSVLGVLHDYRILCVWNDHNIIWHLFDTRRVHVIIIIFIFISIDSDLDPALLSLGLTYTISLAATFQYCIAQSAEVENIVSQKSII